ncbi:MAG: flagellar basal-body rod protein FlgG, partial [Planctomycetota bacterium]
MKAMYTAATGMDAQTIRIDTIANNLANASTTGFKKSQVDFADLMYVVLRRPGAEQTEATETPTGLEVGTGVTPVSTLKIFTGGPIANTAGEFDLAITGRGFFQVETPTGEIKYTRDGNFRVSADGTVVTSQGYPLYPRLTVPTDAIAVNIGSDGTVTATTPGSDPSQIGSIQLADFTNPAGLSSDGANLYSETVASGPVTIGTPGDIGLGEIKQGYLEMSNVEVVTELVDLIIAQRTYELNSKVVKAGDRILQATNY